MTEGERKITEMLLGLARSVRRGRNTDAELARAAAAREIQFQIELNGADNILPMAASFARRESDPGDSPTPHDGGAQ